MKLNLYFLLMLLPVFGMAQQRYRLYGRVADDRGALLAGATITLDKPAEAVTTDRLGGFNMETTVTHGRLTVSYVGYVPVTLSFSDTLFAERHGSIGMIILRPMAIDMKEVTVSSGYQQLAKGNTTGSYAEVGPELLDRSVSTDIIAKLEGVTPALNFDHRSPQGDVLSVRGYSTILSDNTPLIVVDNFPFDGDLHSINPNDVASVTVLKDAAAAAIWGARAGNGVIVITTRHGRYNQPARVTLNASLTIGSKPNLFYSPEFLNSADFISVEKQLFAQGFYDNALSVPGTFVTPAVELLAAERNGQVSAASADAQLAAMGQQDVRRDFEKYFYQRSLDQQYSVSADGGTEFYDYYVSGGLDQDRSNLTGNRDSRYTFSARNNFRLFKDFTLGTDINYTGGRTVTDNPGYASYSSGAGLVALYPYARLADASGNPLAVAKDYPLSYAENASGQGYLDWTYKPLTELRLADNVTQSSDIRLKFNSQYKLADGLSAEALYQYEGSRQEGTGIDGTDTYYTRNLINEYMQPGGVYPVPLGSIIDNTSSSVSSQSGRFQLGYDHLFGGVHQLNAVGGFEMRNTVTETGTDRLYGYDKNLLISQPVDYTDLYFLNPTGNDYESVPYIDSRGRLTDRYVSEYLSANYNYKELYDLSASARKDASNLFGVNANQKWVPLYSVGGGWQLSKEKFYEVKAIPYLKLRATYGYTGNVNKSVTAYTTAFYDTDLLTHLPDALILTPPNPDLQWETVRTVNLGADFETAGKRISGSLEYYWKKSSNLLGNRALDPTTGYFVSDRYSTELNSAGLDAKGADIEINTINTRSAVGWRSRLLFSYAVNKITNYSYQNPVGDYFSADAPALDGRPVLGVYSYRWAGLDPRNGNPVIYLDGKPSEDYGAIATTATVNDLVYNGPALPPYSGSLMNTFSWRRFTASFNIIYKFGYYFRRPSISYSGLIDNYQGNSDFDKRWQKPGDERTTNVPSLSLDDDPDRDNAYINSSVLVDKGDNIRLQDAQLSYDLVLPAARFGIRDLTVYAYASNLGILWRANKDGLDPDYVFGTSVIRPVTTVSLGLKVHF